VPVTKLSRTIRKIKTEEMAEKIDRVLDRAGEGVPEEYRLIMYKSLTL